ncbi:MAG: hypothetical protein WC590_11045 [Burkholderiaceae bacterium]
MNKTPLTLSGANAPLSDTASVRTVVAAGKAIVATRIRRSVLRMLCRRTRSLRRSLRQFTREIYICP